MLLNLTFLQKELQTITGKMQAVDVLLKQISTDEQYQGFTNNQPYTHQRISKPREDGLLRQPPNHKEDDDQPPHQNNSSEEQLRTRQTQELTRTSKIYN